jgi:hypothetical protein
MLNPTRSILPAVIALVFTTVAPTSLADTIIACSAKVTGVVRLVSDASKCRKFETAFSFNSQGVQGPAGPPGPEGQVGAQGPAGPGVKTIAGIVLRTGAQSPSTLYGFSVLRVDAGTYELTFPEGSFQHFPVIAVTPNAGPDGTAPFAIARVQRVLFWPDSGKAVATVQASSTSPDFTPVDNGFHFVAAESLPPPAP